MGTLSDYVLDRDNYKCAYCKGYAACADHVLPKSKGGPDIENNLVAACNSCNSKKGNKFTVEYLVPGFFQILSKGGNLDWIDTWKNSKGVQLNESVKTAVNSFGSTTQDKLTVAALVESPITERTKPTRKPLLQRCVQCNKFFQKMNNSKCNKCLG